MKKLLLILLLPAAAFAQMAQDGDFPPPPPPGDFDGPPPFDEPPPRQQMMQNGQNATAGSTEIHIEGNGEYADVEIVEEVEEHTEVQEAAPAEPPVEEKPDEEPEKKRDSFVPFDEANMDVSNFAEGESDIIKKLFDNNPFGTPPVAVSSKKEDEKKANSLELSAIYCVNDKWFFSVYDTREKKYYTLELRGKTSEKVPYSVEFFDDETNSISITSALSTQVLKLKERAAPPKAAAKPQTQPAAAVQPAQAANKGSQQQPAAQGQQQGNQGGSQQAAQGQQQAGGQNQGGSQTPGDNVRTLRNRRGGNANNQQQQGQR